MSSQGINYTAHATEDNSVGSLVWTNYSYCQGATDGTVTRCNIYSVSGDSYYIKTDTYNFSIPSGATIDGVIVTVNRKVSIIDANKYVLDKYARIVSGGTIQGDNKADTSTKWGTSYIDKSYGSNTDKWGLSLTPEIINNSNFGFVLSISGVSNGILAAYVDSIGITIYYTAAIQATLHTLSLLGVGK